MSMVASASREPGFDNQCPGQRAINEEILRGLRSRQKYVLPKYFYDTRGSALFEDITRQPEYYPTRVERAILAEQADTIARDCASEAIIIEPGAGSCEKIRLLLPALQPRAYVPMDISAAFLHDAAQRLNRDFPALQVHAVAADIAALPALPDSLPAGPRLLFYPGSSLGNFTREQARAFLATAGDLVGSGGELLIGIDLHKDSATLDAAYNDAAGVTAAFNLNVLDHLRALTGAPFQRDRFRHVAFYNELEQRIEMHLESQTEHSVDIGGETIHFRRGERLLTEYSHKYTVESFTALANNAGLQRMNYWTDSSAYFALFLLQRD